MNKHLRYQGFMFFVMDQKCRVTIPADWRPEADESLILLLSLAYGMRMVKVLGANAIDEEKRRIMESGSDEMLQCRMLGKLAMRSRMASLDSRGRLLIPADLGKILGLTAGSEVALAGCENHFEIWSKDHFERLLDLEACAQQDALGVY